MTKKNKAAKGGGAKPLLPEKPHRSPPPPFLFERAALGERAALQELYAICAVWARAAKELPAELAPWLADRLQAVSDTIGVYRVDLPVERRNPKEQKKDRQNGDKIERDLSRALGVTKGKAGKSPSRKSLLRPETIARDIQHYVHWHGVGPYEAMPMLREYYETLNSTPDADGVLRPVINPIPQQKEMEAAWQRHGKSKAK